MLLNKERALRKMAEFKMDALIAAYPENVGYLREGDVHSEITFLKTGVGFLYARSA
jgi:hypothetical protein